MLSNNKAAKYINNLDKIQNNSNISVSRESAASPIYEAGKAYYEYLQNMKSESLEKDCDYCTSFMMF